MTTWDSTDLAFRSGGPVKVTHIGGYDFYHDYPHWSITTSTSVVPTRKDDETVNQRGLFNAYIVDPESGIVVWKSDDPFVASNVESARLKAVHLAAVRAVISNPDSIDDYDIIIVRLGNVRSKEEQDRD